MMGSPVSNVVTLAEEMRKYARATIANPLRALLSGAAITGERYDRDAGEFKGRLQPRYTTYDEPLLPPPARTVT